MNFSDINWLAIAFATLANVLLAYLFFESRFAKKWKQALALGIPLGQFAH